MSARVCLASISYAVRFYNYDNTTVRASGEVLLIPLWPICPKNEWSHIMTLSWLAFNLKWFIINVVITMTWPTSLVLALANIIDQTSQEEEAALVIEYELDEGEEWGLCLSAQMKSTCIPVWASYLIITRKWHVVSYMCWLASMYGSFSQINTQFAQKWLKNFFSALGWKCYRIHKTTEQLPYIYVLDICTSQLPECTIFQM